MKLIKPQAIIESLPCDVLPRIERIGRVCYKSEDKITPESSRNFVSMIIERGHESVLEHYSMSVRFICDRGISHELVRHRIASFSQESTRYVNYNKKGCTFIIPPWLNIPEGDYLREQDIHLTPPSQGARVWIRNRFEDEQRYNAFIEMGWKPEMARGELPTCVKTELVMTANFREWRHFMKIRTSRAAHPQMRELTIPLLAEMKLIFPILFDDIIPTQIL